MMLDCLYYIFLCGVLPAAANRPTSKEQDIHSSGDMTALAVGVKHLERVEAGESGSSDYSLAETARSEAGPPPAWPPTVGATVLTIRPIGLDKAEAENEYPLSIPIGSTGTVTKVPDGSIAEVQWQIQGAMQSGSEKKFGTTMTTEVTQQDWTEKMVMKTKAKKPFATTDDFDTDPKKSAAELTSDSATVASVHSCKPWCVQCDSEFGFRRIFVKRVSATDPRFGGCDFTFMCVSRAPWKIKPETVEFIRAGVTHKKGWFGTGAKFGTTFDNKLGMWDDMCGACGYRKLTHAPDNAVTENDRQTCFERDG